MKLVSGRTALFALLAAAPLMVSPAFAQSAPVAGKPAVVAPVTAESLAVVPGKILPAIQTKVKTARRENELNLFVQALENRLTDAVTSTRKFKVVTRGDLPAVLAEQNLAASGNLDAADPQLAQRFKIAGVKSILLFTVDDFQDREESFTSEAMGQTIRRRIIRVAVSAKLIDTTTGQVRESITVPAVTQDDVRGELARLQSTSDRADAIIPELARLISDRIAQSLVDIRFPAKVLAKSIDNTVTFNRGEGSGVKPGQQWGVYAVGDALVDPDTGEVLGAEEVMIGRAVVTSVEPKFAKASLVGDQGVTVGAILRPMAGASEVASPKSSSGAAVSGASIPAEVVAVKLVLDKDRELTLDGVVIEPEASATAFARLAGKPVLIQVATEAPAESVVRVMRALGDAGVSKIEFVSETK